jgi:hypothetical protein
MAASAKQLHREKKLRRRRKEEYEGQEATIQASANPTKSRRTLYSQPGYHQIPTKKTTVPP